MTMRFSSKNAAIALAGTSFAHGLTRNGVAAVPEEWACNHRGAPPAGSPPMYLVTATSTAIVFAASSGATTGDVFASLNHSIMK